MKKQFLTICLLLFVLLQAGYAQDTQHEISFMLGSGLGGLKYTVDKGSNSANFGFQTGVGYTYFINQEFGIVSGLELGLFSSTATLHDGRFTSTHYNSDNDPRGSEPFDYRVSTIGYEEKQKLTVLSIPLMGMYQMPLSDDIRLYARAGLRFSFPLSATNSASAQELAGRGYYASSGGFELPDGENKHGFSVFPNYAAKQDLELKMAYSLCIEAGASYTLRENWKIYGGLFFDYGLNSVRDVNSEASSLLEWNPQGVTAADANSLINVAGEIGPARLLSFGLKLRIAFGVVR